MNMLNTVNKSKLVKKYKLSQTTICNKVISIEIPFVLVKNLSQGIILGNPFLHMLYPLKKISD